jgi:hypothetical protein
MIPTDPVFHKPQSIVAAKNILFSTIFLALLILIVCKITSGFGKLADMEVWTFAIITFIIIWFLTRQIGLGRKWARILLLVFFLAGTVSTIFTFMQVLKANLLIEILFTMLILLQVLAMIFLFTQKSTQWFNSVQSAGSA